MSTFVVINSVDENITMTINEQLVGKFKDNKRNGKGTCYYSSGTKYTGDWVADQKAGQGVFSWPDGDLYEMKYSKVSCHDLL
jgi:hypothetical protein